VKFTQVMNTVIGHVIVMTVTQGECGIHICHEQNDLPFHSYNITG
jgi:hypothetical protein